MRECIQLHERHPEGSPIATGQWEGGKLVRVRRRLQPLLQMWITIKHGSLIWPSALAAARALSTSTWFSSA